MNKRGKLLILVLSLLVLPIISAETLKVTEEHPFLINDEYIPARDLKPGDEIKTSDGKTAIIKEITEVKPDNPFFVFNLDTPLFSNFIVTKDNLVVHNSEVRRRKIPSPQEEAWARISLHQKLFPDDTLDNTRLHLEMKKRLTGGKFYVGDVVEVNGKKGVLDSVIIDYMDEDILDLKEADHMFVIRYQDGSLGNVRYPGIENLDDTIKFVSPSSAKTPTEMIETIDNPQLESALLKITRRDPIDLSVIRETDRTKLPAFEEIENYISSENYEAILSGRKVTTMHTHPYPKELQIAIPSSQDLVHLYMTPGYDSMAIAIRDQKSGVVSGYIFIKKTNPELALKFSSEFDEIAKRTNENPITHGFLEDYESSLKSISNDGGQAIKHSKNFYNQLESLGKKFGFTYRHVPNRNRGFTFDEKRIRFVREN